jgi:hypothetical protein
VMLLLLSGVLTTAIGRLAVGERTSAGRAWRAGFPRLPAIIGAVLLPGIPLAGVWGLYVLAGVGIRMATSADRMAIFLAAAGVPLFAVTVWLVISFALALPIVVLEHAGPRAALRRSFLLVRGNWWRAFGVLAVAAVVLGLAADLMNAPVQILAVALTRNGLNPPIGAVIVSAAGKALAGTVTVPAAVAVTVLLYADLRMRADGLD